MPELPEVETTRRGISPHVEGRRISAIKVRQPALRWPVPTQIIDVLPGQRILTVKRRGKYLLLQTDRGHLIIHLGMSGSLRMVAGNAPFGRHDHVDIRFDNGQMLRYTDPRRFGAVLWTTQCPMQHPLLSHLGPEPLSPEFGGDYLHLRARGRRSAIKTFIMDSEVVPGVGNIYANEALFLAGIDPRRAAGRIAASRHHRLVSCIREVLESAIRQGGTTLRDFVGGDGKPGYFRQSLKVYGRGSQPCVNCGTALRELRLSQRSTVYCPQCQR